MSVRLTSYQPQYFPRLHYFARMLHADVFAIADYVQFVRKHSYKKEDGTTYRGPSYQAHTPIKTRNGAFLLDFPTRHEGLRTIADTQTAFSKPQDRLRNLRLIEQHYHTAPLFNRIFGSLRRLFETEWRSVAELNTATILWGLHELLETPVELQNKSLLAIDCDRLQNERFRLKRIIRFSDTSIAPPNKEAGRDANDWLIDACRSFGADEYYFGGTSADAYMDFQKFQDAGITLLQQDWKGEPYPQLWEGFIPNLSIIDLLMNVSPEKARDILRTPHQ